MWCGTLNPDHRTIVGNSLRSDAMRVSRDELRQLEHPGARDKQGCGQLHPRRVRAAHVQLVEDGRVNLRWCRFESIYTSADGLKG
jgi:hypothetical protein